MTTQLFTLRLDAPSINTIRAALGTLPHDQVAGIIQTMGEQLNAEAEALRQQAEDEASRRQRDMAVAERTAARAKSKVGKAEARALDDVAEAANTVK